MVLAAGVHTYAAARRCRLAIFSRFVITAYRAEIVASASARTMPVKTEKELSETQRSHWLKAVAAIELRNFGYAISLLQGILRQEPQFLTARQLLRRAEVTKNKSAKKKLFKVSTASVAVMKAQSERKKDAKRAVELIE